MTDADRVRVTTVVAVDPVAAFQIFTEEIGVWWKPKVKHLFRQDRTGTLRFEGGRLLETYPGGTEEPFEVGRVLVWAPGERLVFEWRQGDFRPGETTEVEVRFEAAPGGTRVTLEHRGWDAFPPDHPARHGWTGEAFIAMMGLRWGDPLTGLRARALEMRYP